MFFKIMFKLMFKIVIGDYSINFKFKTDLKIMFLKSNMFNLKSNMFFKIILKLVFKIVISYYSFNFKFKTVVINYGFNLKKKLKSKSTIMVLSLKNLKP